MDAPEKPTIEAKATVPLNWTLGLAPPEVVSEAARNRANLELQKLTYEVKSAEYEAADLRRRNRWWGLPVIAGALALVLSATGNYFQFVNGGLDRKTAALEKLQLQQDNNLLMQQQHSLHTDVDHLTGDQQRLQREIQDGTQQLETIHRGIQVARKTQDQQIQAYTQWLANLQALTKGTQPSRELKTLLDSAPTFTHFPSMEEYKKMYPNGPPRGSTIIPAPNE